MKLLKMYGADHDTVALVALLHDVASVTDKEFTKDYHIIESKMAVKMLAQYNLNPEMVELIRICILNHRGSVLKEKTTPEEICLADSDAMTHFYIWLIRKDNYLLMMEQSLF